MRALILAGGRATRLYPLTMTTPKALTPVLGRPFLEHMLAWLRHNDVTDITLLLGHLSDPIRRQFGDGRACGVQLSYLTERQPLGSGGAIKQLEEVLSEPFFAINGDIFTDIDLRAMQAAHADAGAEVSLGLVAVQDPSQYGVVAQDGAGRITQFVEKPPPAEAPSNLINAGVWLFEPAALKRIVDGQPSMVEQELFPELARAGLLYGHVADGYWMDAGTPERYLALHRDLLTGRVACPIPLTERPGWPGIVPVTPLLNRAQDFAPPQLDAAGIIDGPCVIGAGTAVGERAAVAGPASLGANVLLEDGAFVSESVLWDGCRIGRHASVMGSVLAEGCVVEAGAHVENCVLGDGVRVPAGVTLCNSRLDPRAIAA